MTGLLSATTWDVTHGFTTRAGGVSTGSYTGLNLGLSSGDDASIVERNRDLLLGHLGYSRAQVVAFHQVHGDRVLPGDPGWFVDEADAAVTDRDDVLLVVSAADCVPLLFHDPVKGVVGAAHCGWRGTAAGLASKVVLAMAERHESRPSDVRVALGPCMRGSCYQVGPEVIDAFAAAGVPEACWRPDSVTAGRYYLDLPAANLWSLERAGVQPSKVSDLGLCTHCDAEVFYSHRRDRGVTGRHWAYVSLRRAEG